MNLYCIRAKLNLSLDKSMNQNCKSIALTQNEELIIKICYK